MAKKETKSSKAAAAKDEKETKTTQNKSDETTETKATTDPEKKESTKEESSQEESAKNETVDDSRGMSFEEAENEMNLGSAVKLPEWGGFWFKDTKTDQTLVLTKEGEVLDTPHEEYKDRNDWEVAEISEEQQEIIEKYWDEKQSQQDLEEESQKVYKENTETKAVAYNRGFGKSFIKLKKPVKISDIRSRKNLPSDIALDSEFILENGKAYSYKDQTVTDRDLSSELELLKSQK